MAIRLIAIDIDGTSLQRNGLWGSRRLRKAVRAAQHRGILVVPATGRSITLVPKPYLRMFQSYAVLSNGASVLSLRDREPVFQNTIDSQAAAQVARICDTHRLRAFLYIQGVPHYSHAKPMRGGFLGNLQGMLGMLPERRVASLYEKTQEPGVFGDKFDIFGEVSNLEALFSGLKDHPALTFSGSGMDSVEITGRNVTKALALSMLCAHLGISPGETMAIGDSENDMEMLRFAGVGIAVANASAPVKAAADHVVPAFDRDGAAIAIETYALHG